MYDSILIPVDGSDVADAAADAGIAFAEQFDADLHVVYVRDRASGNAPDDEAFGDAATGAVVERATDADVEATAAVLDGDDPVFRVVLDDAADRGVDCIVMGTHGRTGLDRFLLGSVAEEVLRDSPVPVVTVRDEADVDAAFERVVVATDGSDGAMAAVDHAVGLARATGATLHGISVVDTTLPRGEFEAGSLLEALADAGETALDRVEERAEAAGVEAIERSVLHGAPYRTIVDYADDVDADCVVLGTHGRTGMGRFLLGSVTERVVRLADQPVVGVKTDGVDERSSGE